MRKDYMAVTDSSDMNEIEFVEQHWTQIWEREGGPSGAINKIPKKDEYKVIAPYIDAMPEGSKLLDGGCGLGDWTLYFTQSGKPTTGLDISRETVAQLGQRFPEAEFVAADIRDTGFAENSFDGYFSWGVFEHFEEGLGRCIEEAYRVLKPGGVLFISVPYDNLRHSLRAACDWKRKAMPSDYDSRFYQWRLTRGELRSELSSGGFEVLDIKTIHKRQGILRSLHHEFGMSYDWLATKGMSVLLQPFVPGGLVAHMILGIARKPHEA